MGRRVMVTGRRVREVGRRIMVAGRRVWQENILRRLEGSKKGEKQKRSKEEKQMRKAKG